MVKLLDDSQVVNEFLEVDPGAAPAPAVEKAPATGEQRRKSRKIKVNLAELELIVKATPERLLTEKEHGKLQQAHQLLAELLLPPFRNNESAAAIVGGIAAKVAPKERGKGKGRNKRDVYKDAKVVPVPHLELQSGQLCACGCGRLYRLKRPIHFRSFTGQATIEVTLYEQEQLRCNKCGDVFHCAPSPRRGPRTLRSSGRQHAGAIEIFLGPTDVSPSPFLRHAGHANRGCNSIRSSGRWRPKTSASL